MSARAVFVTGTDTGVGKTVVACALVRGFVSRGQRVAVMKPVASGAIRTEEGLRNTDALALLRAANVSAPYAQVNPYCFESAVSPHIAAKDAKIEVDIGLIATNFNNLATRADWIVIEGAGGWLAPVSEAHTMADLATSLAVPALIVVGLRLGCLNHAQLTRESMRGRGVAFAGWIANAIDPAMARTAENLATLERMLGEPPLALLRWAGPAAAHLTLAETAARLMLRAQ